MTYAQLRDGPWAGLSRLYKIVAIILALILAITWWLGRGAEGRFGCLPGASTAAVSGSPAVPAPSTTVSSPTVAAAAPAAAVPVVPTPAPITKAVEPAAASPAAPTASAPPAPAAPTAPAALSSPPVPATPATVPDPAPVAEAKPTPSVPSASKAATTKPATPAGESVPVAKVHFALDRTRLWSGANKEMAPVLAYLKANPSSTVILSGFHDPSGNKDHNIELAKNRSHAVRDRLIALGINRSRIIEQKPTETTGDGTLSEARRVEITVQP